MSAAAAAAAPAFSDDALALDFTRRYDGASATR